MIMNERSAWNTRADLHVLDGQLTKILGMRHLRDGVAGRIYGRALNKGGILLHISSRGAWGAVWVTDVDKAWEEQQSFVPLGTGTDALGLELGQHLARWLDLDVAPLPELWQKPEA